MHDLQTPEPLAGAVLWVSNINRVYYKIDRLGYRQAADLWNASPFWASMERGKTYCTMGEGPIGFLLTGPTMHDFHIVDRPNADLCPADTMVIQKPE